MRFRTKNYFRRSHCTRRRSLIVAVASIATLALGGSPASARDSSSCAGFDQHRCTIRLSTGITMRYVEVGPARGPVILLLHGYTGSSMDWARVVPVLHGLMPQADIIVPDLRGHGESSMPPALDCAAVPASCFEWQQFAADIVALMDARHIHRAAIVAHSMGTLVAQELGLSYPQRVSRLVLISTAAAGQEPVVESVLRDVVEGAWQTAFTAAGYSWPAGVYDLPPAVAAPGLSDFIAGFDGSAVTPSAFLDQVQSSSAATRLGTWIGALQNIVATDNTERLRGLTVPTLVLYAIQDFVFTPADQQTLIDSLTAAAAGSGSFWWKQYGELPPPPSGEQTDLGHELIWEAPAGVATDIASYLTDGQPTRTLYRTDYPADLQRVIAEPGRATLIHRP